MLRADLHAHTCYSRDSSTSLEAIVARCLKIGINCIAVTDHNTIAGALQMKRIAPFKIIVGEEVRTPYGEIIGLFLTEEIPKGLSPEEVANRIKAQGGLVCIPHPFDRLRRSPLRLQALESLLPKVDIVEIFNSRTTLLRDSARAKGFAQKHGLLAGAGSDAHTAGEVGGAYVEMPDFSDPEGFRKALAQGKVFGHRACPLVHLASSFTALRKGSR